jgi:hypothetical protein
MGLSRENAYMLCSLAAGLRVTQILNGQNSVHVHAGEAVSGLEERVRASPSEYFGNLYSSTVGAMLHSGNTLLCVFSFNMGRTLDICLRSIARHCPDLPLAIADDASDDPETLRVLAAYKSRLRELYSSSTPKVRGAHGNLYANIERMCAVAVNDGFSYLFMIQDDMQIVRPFESRLRDDYYRLLQLDDVLQVDPRFLRASGPVDILEDEHAYCFPPHDYRRSYADVGIIDLRKLTALKWRFLSNERENKKALSVLGYRRLFPFSPSIMHVPFPAVYRNRKRKRLHFPINRGAYHFHDLNPSEIEAMDRRDLKELPYFRAFLRPRNMMALTRAYYARTRDAELFR